MTAGVSSTTDYEKLTLDANGNLTSDGATAYVYDAENRLVSASGAKAATLSYDPLGRLWQITGPSGTTRFVYDGDRVMSEYNGSGAVQRYFGWGAGVDEPLLWFELGSTRRYLHADERGSIVAVSNDAGPLAVNRYDEWGNPAAGNIGRFQYTGQAWLAELGLYYYKARLYSPTLGRFLQTDPIGYDDQINLYAYVGNDPVNGRDPAGTCGTRIKGEVSPGCSEDTVLGEIGDRRESSSPGGPREYGQGGRTRRSDPTGGDLHLTLAEANRHYREGEGAPVDVDASRLTVTLDQTPTKPGDTVSSTVNNTGDFVVHGKVNVTLQRDGSLRIVDAMYDFDISSRRDALRNSLTRIGRAIAGRGTPFLIRYHGSPRISPRTPLRPYDPCIQNPGRC